MTFFPKTAFNIAVVALNINDGLSKEQLKDVIDNTINSSLAGDHDITYSTLFPDESLEISRAMVAIFGNRDSDVSSGEDERRYLKIKVGGKVFATYIDDNGEQRFAGDKRAIELKGLNPQSIEWSLAIFTASGATVASMAKIWPLNLLPVENPHE